MGTTAEKLAYLADTKADIRAAMIEKGLSVPTSTPFRGYGNLIRTMADSPPAKKALNNMTWDEISQVSEMGLAYSYYAIGDRKSVYVSGKIGTYSVSKTYYVFIIGFDHNRDIEGPGITFGTFFESLSATECIALVDSKYGKEMRDDTGKYFNINHGVATSDGGWKGCDIRYDVLGSTKTKNADAVSNTATTPVPETLMAALPSSLRSVMKPMSIYSNNVGPTQDETAVTKTIDYLPLLSVVEVEGAEVSAAINQAERTYQKIYDYYRYGNDIRKDRPQEIGGHADWWTRSPYYYDFRWYYIETNPAGSSAIDPRKSLGLSPMFRV